MITLRKALPRIIPRIPGNQWLYGTLRKSALRAAPLTSSADARHNLATISPRPQSSPSHHHYDDAPQCDLSVIIPCYNVADYIDDCLQSVTGQATRYSLEIIAVDDGSTDATAAKLASWAERDHRVRVITQSNAGQAGARNTGLDHAQGSAVLFLDSDDMLAPDSIEAVMDKLERSGADFVSGSYRRVNEHGKSLSQTYQIGSRGMPWGRAYRKEVWDKLRFLEGFQFEDTLQAYCIMPRYREVKEPRCQVLYRVRSTSLSHAASAIAKPNSADGYWVVEATLEQCRKLGIAVDQTIYEQTLGQFGALAASRIAGWNEADTQTFFLACCHLITTTPEFQGLSTTQSRVWQDIELALRTRNYRLWRLACLFAYIGR